jgi:hypothetical protein
MSSSSESRLTDPGQLDTMSQAHHALGDAAHTTADHVTGLHGTLRGCQGWGGPGFDDISGFLDQFVGQMHSFGDLKHQMATSVTQAKENYSGAEAANVRNVTI